MPASTVHCTVKLRSDTAANWTSADPVLGQGEMGIEYDTFKFKIGNGVDCWNDITNPYLVGTGDIEIADKITHIGDTNTAIRFPADDTFTIETAGTEAFRVDSNQKILIGGPTASYANADSDDFQVGVHTSATATGITIGGTSTNSISFADDGDDQAGLIKYTHSDNSLSFHTDGATNERMRIASSGNVGIGITSPGKNLEVRCAQNASGGIRINELSDTYHDLLASGGDLFIHADSKGDNGSANVLRFGVGSSGERMRITSNGDILLGKNTTGNDETGVAWNNPTSTSAYLIATNNSTSSSARVVIVNRQASDGNLIDFRQSNTLEGAISVSGSTVTYGGGHLARWSQLPNEEDPSSLLKGTVLSNLDEMCKWGEEDNEQLNKTKVSDVEGDPNVAGVFVATSFDEEGPLDFFCAMTGDMIIRIAAGTPVHKGQLLMSAGDGTAKPQDDDIIRSKTIAKVTSTHVTCTYDDGSYCVPCVLMAC